MNYLPISVFLFLSLFGTLLEAGVTCNPVPDDVSPVVQRALRSTVTILSSRIFEDPLDPEVQMVKFEIGSGIVFDNQYTILGSGHVAKTEDLVLADIEGNVVGFVTIDESPKSFKMITADCAVYPLRLVAFGDSGSSQPDVAYWYLRDEPVALPVMPKATGEVLEDDLVFMLGSPKGDTNRVYIGEVIWEDERQTKIISSAYVMSGMSGGGALNVQGEMIGIIEGYKDSFGGVSFIIPLQYALEFLGLE